MQRFFKYVITGGPCAGKTTALAIMTKEFQKRGYSVVIVEETATFLIRAGLKPFGEERDKLKLWDFQDLVLKGQLLKEDLILEGAKKIPNEKILVLFDRGTLDNRAYLGDEDFEILMSIAGVTEEGLNGRYDGVIHFVSVAIDKPECYIITDERTEPIEKARQLEIETVRTWRNHKNHIVIFNDCTMIEKADIAVEVILQDIERKEREEEEQKVYQKATK